MSVNPAKIHPEFELPSFDSVQTKPISWLWKHRLPRGKLTLLAGDPATGKTALALDLAARLSTNRPMPDDHDSSRSELSPQSSVLSTLLLSPDDSPSDTLRPKLEALHADLSQIHFLPQLHSLTALTDIHHPQTDEPLTPLQLLEAAIQRIPNLALIVIDPITYYLGLSDKNQKPQGQIPGTPPSILYALARLAEKHNLAILLTTRLAKRLPARTTDLSALRRALGSLSFVTVSRIVNLLHPVSPNPDLDPLTHDLLPTHILTTIKSNLCKPPARLAYAVQDTLHWLPLPPQPDPTPKPPTAIEYAADWLSQMLADGPAKALAIQDDAAENAISTNSLRSAKDQLGVVVTKDGTRGHWYWSLPGDDRPIPKERPESLKELDDRLFGRGRLQENKRILPKTMGAFRETPHVSDPTPQNSSKKTPSPQSQR